MFLPGRHSNREMIREGHAWVYLEYLKDNSLIPPEAAAREKKLGLWAFEGAIAPWQWRKTKP